MDYQDKFEYGKPWLVFDAIHFLENWLKPGMRVFEYGSGVSTFFFAQRVAEVTNEERDSCFISYAGAAFSPKIFQKFH